jgi:hypothetical protein
MPKYLDFDSTKDFRDNLLKRTLNPVYGKSPSPKTFTSSNYSNQTLGEISNIDQPQLDANRKNDLLTPQRYNIFKPTEYFIKDRIEDLPRRANLSLYPYFTPTLDANLIGIYNSSNFNTESELFKFAAHNIKSNPQGLILSRIKQNIQETSNAGASMLNSFGSNNSTSLFSIIRGKQPLKVGTDKITVNTNTVPPTIDFLGTVDGTKLPFDTILGDYLSNPLAPINVRPTNTSAITKGWQDLTGILGPIVGIQRRPLPSRKPSDLLIENMGESSKYRLFDLLTYSKYAPNYTLTAMSQQSSLLFNLPNMIAQGISSFLREGAPRGTAYIGDDRSNDVKNSTNDIFSGRPVRSSYYLSRMFDPIATELFHKVKPITEGGNITGNLTWMSTNRNKNLNQDKDYIGNTDSSLTNFRPDSILDITQQLLNSKPKDGKTAFSHIGHIIDQTSKYFQDGDTLISKGSGVMYLDNSGKDIGVEYARVWTKDRPYLTYGDAMPLYKETTKKPYYKGGEKPFRRTGLRRFDGSVMTNPWNLNIAPMSDGAAGFGASSNIVEKTKGNKDFYAKKYMLSIENLAWKSSTIPGFTINDLPYSERGPNGGRVMWFPPYDMKVSEQNSAKWEPNTFLGRPEPIYTYSNTERTGTLNFKIVVDHPSILNLLIREHFKSVSEDEVEKYIASFFAGAKDIDFYSLIRTYTHLDPSDVELIEEYLKSSNPDPETAKEYKKSVSPVVQNNQNGTTTEESKTTPVSDTFILTFNNNSPSKGTNVYNTLESYDKIKQSLDLNKETFITFFNNALNHVVTAASTKEMKNDCLTMFGKEVIPSGEANTRINQIKIDLRNIIDKSSTSFTSLESTLTKLKEDLDNKSVSKNVVIQIGSSTTKIGDNDNYALSMRRSNSIYLYIMSKIKNNVTPEERWKFKGVDSNIVTSPGQEKYVIEVRYTYKELGYEGIEGEVTIRTTNYGYNANTENGNCGDINFYNENLTNYSTLSYGCRKSTVDIKYKRSKKEDNTETNNKNQITGTTETVKTKKPSIDVMKRIIMKTLSEQYYFKQLEETSPLVFSSMKEKLKYFHPGFHSMTPEGLNSRLTFLQQCLRPGNTIPVKGLADNSDIDARNTSFGPPPICVLRVGDFYNSKVVIKDLNIQFEENTWDLNPEGIGIQPMIADVTIQLNFLGGHGLEKPIERLQNALSSNFYANTEMYDERSEETTTSIGGQTGNTFTVDFLDSLNNDYNIQQNGLKDENGKGYVEGKYIGEPIIDETTKLLKSINYTNLIPKVYENVSNYFNQYQDTYNNILWKYGQHVTNLMFNEDYRTIKTYKYYDGPVEGSLNLFGVYPNDSSLSLLVDNFIEKLNEYLTKRNESKGYIYILEMLKLTNVVEPDYQIAVGKSVHDYIIENIPIILHDLNTIPNITKYETTRNELISSLDGLNFVNKNGYDVKFADAKTYKVTFSDYTAGDLFKGYKNAIDYIVDNTEKLYSKLKESINFLNVKFNDPTDDNFDQDVQDILQTIFYSHQEKLVITMSGTLMENDYLEFEMANNIKDKLEKVMYRPNGIKFNFPKIALLKNNNIISYTVLSEIVDETSDEVKKLLSTKNTVTNKNDILNYYKP